MGEPSTQLNRGKKGATLTFEILDSNKYQTYLEYFFFFCLPKGFIQIYSHTDVVLPFGASGYLLADKGTTNLRLFCVILTLGYVVELEFLAFFQRNFRSLSPVMITRSPKFFLQKSLADSMSNFSLLMKYCVWLYIIHPSSVVLYTGKGFPWFSIKEKDWQ